MAPIHSVPTLSESCYSRRGYEGQSHEATSLTRRDAMQVEGPNP